MIDTIFLSAMLAGLGVAVAAGPLGCFVIWRRMAYFGDALAHSALLGIALGMVLGSLGIGYASSGDYYAPIASIPGIMLTGLSFALLLMWLQSRELLSVDSLLGILAHSALSLGIVLLHLMDLPQMDIHSVLFGNILTVTAHDLWWIGVGSLSILVLLKLYWQKLTLITLHQDLAKAEGIATTRINLLFMLMITLMVAISVHIIGILLMTSMLIIPAATARQLSHSPHGMAIIAALCGIMATGAGLYGSFVLDTPSGATIVLASACLFFGSLIISLVTKRHS